MSAQSALLKIFLVLLHTYCNHLIWTAPNPPPNATERRSYRRNAFERFNDYVHVGVIMKVSMRIAGL